MQSDLPIPSRAAIADRIADYRASAERQHDDATIARLGRLEKALDAGATLCWQLGVLHIGSPSGNTYHVTRAGCDCLNAKRCSKRQCWHLSCFELLLDLFATDCETRDMEAECVPPDTPIGDDLPDDIPPTNRRPLGVRLAAARAQYAYV